MPGGGLPSYEGFISGAPEAPPKQYRLLSLLLVASQNDMVRPATEGAMALVGTELEAFFLLATVNNAERY